MANANRGSEYSTTWNSWSSITAVVLLRVEAQERKECVVERHRHIHVSDGYLYVVNDRFHGARLDSGWEPVGF